MDGKLFLILAACASLGLAGPAAAAGDAAAGKAQVKKCSACHGVDGVGKKPNPPLAGLSYDKHVAAMQEYKSGARKHKMMQMLVKKMSDKDIEDLAAYYSSLK
jgi:cytochrome c553